MSTKGLARLHPHLPEKKEDLGYSVELWDATKNHIEALLATTVNVSIGFAAYYAAVKEFPERYITLRYRGAVVSRWNGPTH